MGREKAPVELTGGAGFEFEDDVAGRFLIDLLAGRCSVSSTFGQVTKIAWQARESGWLTDDIVLTCQLGTTERQVALSLKSDRQVTRSGFPTAFVRLAWEQWRGLRGAVALKGTDNAVGFVVGDLAASVEAAWSQLVTQLRESRVDLGRVLARINSPDAEDLGTQSSVLERSIVSSLRCPLEGATEAEPSVEGLELISQLCLLHLDFRTASSEQAGIAIADCCSLLVSGDAAEARLLWDSLRAFAGRKRSSGGTTTLAELLHELRSRFALRHHPDFEASWRNLDRSFQDSIEMVSTDIGGIGSIPRTRELDDIRKGLREHKAVVLVGPSGAGKSALAKTIATDTTTRACWLTADLVDQDNVVQVEQRLGLSQPLDAVLEASPSICTVIVDAVEKFSIRALDRLEQMMRRLLSRQTNHVQVLLTTQTDGARAVSRLIVAGLPRDRITQVQIENPSEEDIRAILSGQPNVHWALLNPSVRPVLRTLKIADWVMRAVQSGAILDASEVVSVSALIAWLWECPWIDGADDGDERSSLLMSLAINEGESLSAGVPRTVLDPAQQRTLRGLEQSGALVRQNERIFFQHDLLSDWSRLHVLMADHPVSVPNLRKRAANPRWHNAVRLYGLLLRRTSNDVIGMGSARGA